MRCHDQPAVEVVRPLMVRARDPPGHHATGEQRALAVRGAGIRAAEPGAAMPAYIIEGAQLALSIAQQDDALAEHIQHPMRPRSEEHTSELQSQSNLVCRLLL